MSPFHLTIVIFTVFLSASAQLLLKFGAEKISITNNGVIYGNSIASITNVLLNPYIIFGMFIYILSAGIWIWVLSKVAISLAYPFVSISFVLTLFAGAAFFNEPMTYTKVVGTCLIIVGCYVITRT